MTIEPSLKINSQAGNGAEIIREAGARFQSLSEPWATTTTHADNLIITVFAGIAEFEVGLFRERTSAGRKAARRRRTRFGRSGKLNAEQAKLAQRLIDQGKSVREIADTLNVHTATLLSALTDGGLTIFLFRCSSTSMFYT
jgi:DNA invertase Pin-like site-specific DNA recombinase